jgi:hypothetical protein
MYDHMVTEQETKLKEHVLKLQADKVKASKAYEEQL